MKTKEQKQNRNFIALNISVILLLIAMAMGSAVSAQPPGGGGQQGPPPIPNAKQIKKTVAKLSSQLSLSDEQETKVLALYTDHYDQVKEATSKGRPDRSKMEALESTFEKNVKSELTKEQKLLYAEYLKKNTKQRRGQPE